MIHRNPTDLASQAWRFAEISGRKRPTPHRALPRAGTATAPTGLAASSRTETLHALAQFMLQSSVTTFLAESVDEARRILDRQEVQLVICDDRLIDGEYEDILRTVHNARATPPIIVVSPTGDWPDYLEALSAGAFDYIPYPPIPGELPRAIRQALCSKADPSVEEHPKGNYDWRMGEIL
jgi:DNA-binding NtrC family response regulator